MEPLKVCEFGFRTKCALFCKCNVIIIYNTYWQILSPSCTSLRLESVHVCERAVELLEPGATAKKCTDPKTKSFSIIAEMLNDLSF